MVAPIRWGRSSFRCMIWVISVVMFAAMSEGFVVTSSSFRSILLSSSRRTPAAPAIDNANAMLLNALPTPEESAQALTDYMAKAHEAKLKAVATEAAKYKDQIQELEKKLADCEEERSRAASGSSSSSSLVASSSSTATTQPVAELPSTTALTLQQNSRVAEEKEFTSYEFPATNKALTERISAYQKFISEYIVQAQIEKTKAVADAEKKIKVHYENIIDQMRQEQQNNTR